MSSPGTKWERDMEGIASEEGFSALLQHLKHDCEEDVTTLQRFICGTFPQLVFSQLQCDCEPPKSNQEILASARKQILASFFHAPPDFPTVRIKLPKAKASDSVAALSALQRLQEKCTAEVAAGGDGFRGFPFKTRESCELLKSEGNKNVQEGQHDKALHFYTTALCNCPVNDTNVFAVILANRSAAALLQFKQLCQREKQVSVVASNEGESGMGGDNFTGCASAELLRWLATFDSKWVSVADIQRRLLCVAIGDAAVATQVSPQYAKGWYRLGNALMQLGHVEGFKKGVNLPTYLEIGNKFLRRAESIAVEKEISEGHVSEKRTDCIERLEDETKLIMKRFASCQCSKARCVDPKLVLGEKVWNSTEAGVCVEIEKRESQRHQMGCGVFTRQAYDSSQVAPSESDVNLCLEHLNKRHQNSLEPRTTYNGKLVMIDSPIALCLSDDMKRRACAGCCIPNGFINDDVAEAAQGSISSTGSLSAIKSWLPIILRFPCLYCGSAIFCCEECRTNSPHQMLCGLKNRYSLSTCHSLAVRKFDARRLLAAHLILHLANKFGHLAIRQLDDFTDKMSYSYPLDSYVDSLLSMTPSSPTHIPPLSKYTALQYVDTMVNANWLATCVLGCPKLNLETFETTMKLYAAVGCNSFDMSVYDIRKDKYNIVSHGLFLAARFFNHSCNPNSYVSTTQNRNLQIRLIRPVKSGEELCISYGPLVGCIKSPLRLHSLSTVFGFDCQCPHCKPMSGHSVEGLVYDTYDFFDMQCCPKCNSIATDCHSSDWPTLVVGNSGDPSENVVRIVLPISQLICLSSEDLIQKSNQLRQYLFGRNPPTGDIATNQGMMQLRFATLGHSLHTTQTNDCTLDNHTYLCPTTTKPTTTTTSDGNTNHTSPSGAMCVNCLWAPKSCELEKRIAKCRFDICAFSKKIDGLCNSGSAPVDGSNKEQWEEAGRLSTCVANTFGSFSLEMAEHVQRLLELAECCGLRRVSYAMSLSRILILSTRSPLGLKSPEVCILLVQQINKLKRSTTCLASVNTSITEGCVRSGDDRKRLMTLALEGLIPAYGCHFPIPINW